MISWRKSNININKPDELNIEREYRETSTEVKVMKKTGVLISLLIFILVPSQIYAQPDVECPKLKTFENTTMEDKDELLKALKVIVPDIYAEGEYGELYSEWEVITALPFPKTVGKEKDEAYYEMAKNFCGEEIADKSWLVRLYFPKWEGISASALEGQIFLAKSKDNEWFVWFRYH
ncbi:hypothetical protein SAMN04487943_11457 [Gracilibacillus orientalis]|uniref:Uncharacterized protein n=1 Tax=Gracilibacillus orientalis TaxID=334253 RepID=A0A1I4Q3Q5_9BACI|nr:hypothetical protein [Gracilibacillus orientalis]SFM34692.1 hypothetical protein SAMN04487943_11457 [Gracilibacillus orientalis]